MNMRLHKGDHIRNENLGMDMIVESRNYNGLWYLLASDEYDEDTQQYVNYETHRLTDAEMCVLLHARHVFFEEEE